MEEEKYRAEAQALAQAQAFKATCEFFLPFFLFLQVLFHDETRYMQCLTSKTRWL